MDEIVIETRNVQKQLGGSNYGLFALAFITAVLNNQDPTALCFEQNKMRRHLTECLENKQSAGKDDEMYSTQRWYLSIVSAAYQMMAAEWCSAVTAPSGTISSV